MPSVVVPPVVDIALHVETGHFLAESLAGILIGAGLVVAYLVALRLLGGRDDSRARDCRDRPGSEG